MSAFVDIPSARLVLEFDESPAEVGQHLAELATEGLVIAVDTHVHGIVIVNFGQLQGIRVSAVLTHMTQNSDNVNLGSVHDLAASPPHLY